MSLHNGTKRKSGRIMRKPLTSKDREHYVHGLREREGRNYVATSKRNATKETRAFLCHMR